MSSTSSDLANQRLDLRRNALLPAIIASLDGQLYFDCAINNLSVTGARLTIPRSAKLAPRFFFINVRDRLVHRASVVWRSENRIGLRYHDRVALGVQLGPSMYFLNRLWLQRA